MDCIIQKETILYRARKDEGTPLINENDWWLPPKEKVKRGRFNHEEKPVLYVGTMKHLLPREIGLQSGETYYLASYKCKRTFSVGSLLKQNDYVTDVLHQIAMAIEDDSKLTEKERNNLNINHNQLTPKEVINDNTASLYLHHFIKKDLYMITNKLADLILKENPYGIRYCSCFSPIEISGGPYILTLNGVSEANYALTNIGIANLEWVNCEKKIYTEEEYNNDLSLYIAENNKSILKV